MSDSVLAFLLIVAFFVLTAAVRFFKTLDDDVWRAVRMPVIAGLLAGIVLTVAPLHPAIIAITLTVAAWWGRLSGHESEPVDGMLVGATTGASAAIPLVIARSDDALYLLSVCILAAATAGYGVTFAALHVVDKLRQLALDGVATAAAVAVAFVPEFAERNGVDERAIAFAAASSVPLLALAAVFQQWRHVREELRDEASLGFIDQDDVRTTAHPLFRLGRGGWHDREAHREFVRLANQIALRKRQQRRRSGEVARIYQLEIMKLRMQMQQMSEINRAAHPEASDTIRPHEA